MEKRQIKLKSILIKKVKTSEIETIKLKVSTIPLNKLINKFMIRAVLKNKFLKLFDYFS